MGLQWEESRHFRNYSEHESVHDMLSQVYFNQRPFEFVYMNISERFDKFPFS